MRAIVCTKYVPPNVLHLREVDKPSPRDHEVLVKIHATTVTSSDCIVRGFKLPLSMWIPARIAPGLRGLRKPILGVELAGEIEAIGKSVRGRWAVQLVVLIRHCVAGLRAFSWSA